MDSREQVAGTSAFGWLRSRWPWRLRLLWKLGRLRHRRSERRTIITKQTRSTELPPIPGQRTCWPGPSIWSSTIHPQVTPDVRTADLAAPWAANGRESNAWVHFLLWKQSLDPARFAHYHPHVAARSRSNLHVAAWQPSDRPTIPPHHAPRARPPRSRSRKPLTPAVPEPGPWLLAARS